MKGYNLSLMAAAVAGSFATASTGASSLVRSLFSASKRGNTSSHTAHQGAGECARRVRQMQRGILTKSNGAA